MITTKRAYEELERDGFLVSIPGKGSYVAGVNLEFVKEERLRRIEERMRLSWITDMDPIVRDEIRDIFLEFIQDESHGVFLSSHILSDLEKVCWECLCSLWVFWSPLP